MMQPFAFMSKAIVRRVKDARLDLLTDPRSCRHDDFQTLGFASGLAMSVDARGLCLAAHCVSKPT